MNCDEPTGGLKNGAYLPPFPENTFIASRCVADLNPVVQVEGPRQGYELFFHRKPEAVFHSVGYVVPGCDSLPRIVFLIVIVPWGPVMQSLVAIKAR